MGTWGSGIFDDDLALDIKGDLIDFLESGLNIDGATKKILLRYSEILADNDEGPIVYLSLAALQVEHGILQTQIRDMAINIIEKGSGLNRWEGAGAELLAERKGVLLELKLKLESYCISS